MRYYFNQQLCKYSIKKEEIDVSELPAWDTRIVGSIIDKIGVITGHLKTEQFDQAYVAYFDCKFHKKSKYMLEISEYVIWNTYRIKNIDVMINTKKNGEKCECKLYLIGFKITSNSFHASIQFSGFKRDDWETSFRRIFADYIQSSSDDNDCGDDEMDENDKEHDEQVSQEVTKQDEPSVDENCKLQISKKFI